MVNVAESTRSITKLFAWVEPFLIALLATVLLASLWPPRGVGIPLFDTISTAGIVLLFFLHGAKLSREAVIAGARNWRVHAVALATTFILFPIAGFAASMTPGLNPIIAAGIVFLTLLPSTVQSSIAFVAIARGDVASAICSASLSNLLGIFITPMLVAILMHTSSGPNGVLDGAGRIAVQLLLPFIAGQLARPWIGGFVGRHKRLVSFVDRGSIILVVFSAFGAATREGLLQRISTTDLVVTILLCAALLALAIAATWIGGKALGMSRADRIVLLFCGSKKSLASGVPMSGALFPATQAGILIVPLMLFHQLQLIVCAIIARRLEREETAS